jgi:pimeloyl-ACP methyl ester carboxylesterase
MQQIMVRAFDYANIPRTPALFVIAWLVLLGGCARLPDTGKTLLQPKTFSELQVYLRTHKADLEQFRLRGPFAVTAKDNYEIRLSTTELVSTDLFLSAHPEKAPLVIIVHGHDSDKESHTYQALHLASWGMHCLVVQLPNHGPWLDNGKTLAELAKFIHSWPAIIDGRIDVNKIILAGHSYGGAAAAIALAEGAPAGGGILLDPAYDGKDLPPYLRKIRAPVMVLGADEHYSRARNREYFYRYIRGDISEISIKDATHDDAQYPAGPGPATEEMQLTFVSAMVSTAFSLSFAGNFDFAWSSFDEALANGQFINAEKK